jgi:hypothetical protein
MRTLEYTTIDKSNWPQGPWTLEFDKKQWQDEATGLPCLIVRNKGGGHLCGYVGVTKDHPLFRVGYADVDLNESPHGGLTFSDHCQPNSEEDGICHLVEEGEDDQVWWLGFDCAHCMDLSPAYSFSDGAYRNVEYVANECRALALELSKVERPITQPAA